MKRGHAAALALVGWYLILPPTHCCQNSDPKAPNYDVLCGATKCGGDVKAPLSQWVVKGTYDSVNQCASAASKTSIKDSMGNSIPAQCVLTDDPRLKPP